MSGDHEASPGSHWAAFSHVLNRLKHPLKPSREDIDLFQHAISSWSVAHGEPAALIMGVTPELYDLAWPARSRVMAMDNNPDMIANAWPGQPEDALCCDWRDMCLPDQSIDIAVCDGGLIMVPYPDGTAAIVSELNRVLRPGGVFACRHYLPPSPPESPEDVVTDLLAGNVPSPNHLKLRMWGASQTTPEAGVGVPDVWEVLSRRVPDLSALAELPGWNVADVSTLEPYRTSTYRYHLPGLEHIRTLLEHEPGGFAVTDVLTPSVPLGDRSPTTVAVRLAR